MCSKFSRVHLVVCTRVIKRGVIGFGADAVAVTGAVTFLLGYL